MNTISLDFKPFIEHDNSPFLLFNAKGKIIYLNTAAELLMGYVQQKELYDLLLIHAPKSYGYKTTTLSLQYHTFHFYAITIGYQDDDIISIRLYHKTQSIQVNPHNLSHSISTDINTLLEANIHLFKMYNTHTLTLFVDQDIPLFKLEQNDFSKLLRKTLESFTEATHIAMRLTFLLGEYIIIDGKKEQLIQLHIKANTRFTHNDQPLHTLANKNHITCTFQPKEIYLHIPFIR